MKIIHDVEKPDKYYSELPDGYRLVYEDGKYAGRYNPELNEVI